MSVKSGLGGVRHRCRGCVGRYLLNEHLPLNFEGPLMNFSGAHFRGRFHTFLRFFCFTGEESPELRKKKRSGCLIDGKESFYDAELQLGGPVAFLNVYRCCALHRVALCPGAFAETSTSLGQTLRAQLTG